MAENTKEINQVRLRELMDEFESTKDRRRKREIENEVLAETVWKVSEEEYIITESEVKILLDSVDDDDKTAKWILTEYFLDKF